MSQNFPSSNNILSAPPPLFPLFYRRCFNLRNRCVINRVLLFVEFQRSFSRVRAARNSEPLAIRRVTHLAVSKSSINAFFRWRSQCLHRSEIDIEGWFRLLRGVSRVFSFLKKVSPLCCPPKKNILSHPPFFILFLPS